MTERAAPQSGDVKIYNPADVYLPLTDRSAAPEALVDLLFTRCSPALPLRVLMPEQDRQKHIKGVVTILKTLKERYAVVLRAQGENAVAEKILTSGRLMNVSDICREVRIAHLRFPIDDQKLLALYKLLVDEEEGMNAEFMACLGFLPQGMRDSALEENESFTLLHDEIDPEILNGGAAKDWDEFMAKKVMDGGARKCFRDVRLHEWMKDANGEFGRCIREAFGGLETRSKKLSPPGLGGQPFGMIDDLGTQSMADLLSMMLDNENPLVKRFEAIRLLERAIYLYSIKNNPIYEAQEAVRRRIHDLLAVHVWTGQFTGMPVPPKMMEYILKTEFPDREVSPDDLRPITLQARRVNVEVRQILGDGKRAGVFSQTDGVVFESREKGPDSAASKMQGEYATVEACRACLRGEFIENLTLQRAKEKLAEFKKRSGLDEAGFKVKPVSFGTLDDHVGCAIVIPLEKPVDEFTSRDDRSRVRTALYKVASAIDTKLGLKNTRPELRLFSDDERVGKHNGKKSPHFHVYKLHGSMDVETEIFGEDGRRKPRLVTVPVELQFQPLETYVRGLMDGPTGHSTYDERKVEAVADLLLPCKIDGQKLFPNRDPVVTPE